jgi:hypothetical protein
MRRKTHKLRQLHQDLHSMTWVAAPGGPCLWRHYSWQAVSNHVELKLFQVRRQSYSPCVPPSEKFYVPPWYSRIPVTKSELANLLSSSYSVWRRKYHMHVKCGLQLSELKAGWYIAGMHQMNNELLRLYDVEVGELIFLFSHCLNYDVGGTLEDGFFMFT